MSYNQEEEQSGIQSVSEPAFEYNAVPRRHPRTISDEELARCMTLEESERLITEKIYRFYHPQA